MWFSFVSDTLHYDFETSLLGMQQMHISDLEMISQAPSEIFGIFLVPTQIENNNHLMLVFASYIADD